MFKKCSVVMLATKEKAKVNMINLAPYNREGQKLELIHYVTNSDGLHSQHLYILSDEDVKEGDWVYITKSNTIRKVTRTSFGNSSEFCEVNGFNAVFKEYCKKIIATTDISLTTCQCRKVGYHKLSCKQTYNLPQPSQGFIKVFIEEYNKSNVITDIMVDYAIDQEEGELAYIGGENKVVEKIWLSKANNEYYFDTNNGLDSWTCTYNKVKINPKDNTITIKKLKDSWSREEVIELIKKFDIEMGDTHGPSTRNKWIEENL